MPPSKNTFRDSEIILNSSLSYSKTKSFADESDNLSVSSVTKRIALMNSSGSGKCNEFDDFGSETNNDNNYNLAPSEMSDTLLAVNISEAICKGDLEDLEILLRNLNTSPKEFNSSFGNLLHISISVAKLENFKKIYKWSGLNPNCQNLNNDGSTPLHLATRLERQDIVEFLLSLEEIDDTIKDFNGKTCLDYCTNKQIKNLIEYSRNVYKEKILKSLYKAVQKKNLKFFKELCSNPRNRILIDFNSPNSHGDTILHMAAKTEIEEIVKICLEMGTDPFVKNRRGKIPFELCHKANIKKLLKQAPMTRSKEIPTITCTKVEGYLLKYTNFAGGYRRRWFVLENGIISYYNSPMEYPVSCRGSINLEYVQIIPSSSNTCKFDLIGVRNSNVKFHLKAEAQDEAKRWIIALQQSIAIANLATNLIEEADNTYQNNTNTHNNTKYPMNFLNICSSESNFLDKLKLPNDLQVNYQNLNLNLGITTITQHEAQLNLLFESIHSSLPLSQTQLIEFQNTLLNNCKNLKDFFTRFEVLFAQKNRRLEAQRKEKDLLEDAVRSLALENNKWQTWARSQLTRLDSHQSKSASLNEGTRSLTGPVRTHSAEDVLKSLENHIEDTKENKMCPESSTYSTLSMFETSEEEEGEEDNEIFYDVFDDSVKEENDDIMNKIKEEKSDTDTDKYGYALIKREKIPVDSSKMPAISLWSILKNAIRQQDLTRMPIPINFSEPLSMLQRMCEDLEYFELLETAKEFENDPARRLLQVAIFAISSYSGTDKRISKPFNPLLGETFELISPKFKYLSEQVSHHPPIGASHCIGEGFTYWNEVHVTSRFRGKYLELRPEGISHIKFNNSNTNTTTHYSWNRVNTAVNNIIVGKIYLEHYGKMIIRSHGEDALVAEINFLPGGWGRGTSNRIEGKVYDPLEGLVHYKINGTWNQSIMVTNPVNSESFQIWSRKPSPPDSELMYNFSYFAMTLNETNEKLSRSICPTDSRLRPDQRAMEEGQFELASKLKVKLEENQRKSRKLLVKLDPEFEYNPKWFKREIEEDTQEGHWKFNEKYWKIREELQNDCKSESNESGSCSCWTLKDINTDININDNDKMPDINDIFKV